MAKNEKDGGAAAGRAGRRVGEGAANAFSFEQFIYLKSNLKSIYK